MSVTGLCQICETEEAEHSCPNCGTLVCQRHWDEGMDLCVQCAPAGEGVGDGQATPEELDDDDVMRF